MNKSVLCLIKKQVLAKSEPSSIENHLKAAAAHEKAAKFYSKFGSNFDKLVARHNEMSQMHRNKAESVFDKSEKSDKPENEEKKNKQVTSSDPREVDEKGNWNCPHCRASIHVGQGKYPTGHIQGHLNAHSNLKLDKAEVSPPKEQKAINQYRLPKDGKENPKRRIVELDYGCGCQGLFSFKNHTSHQIEDFARKLANRECDDCRKQPRVHKAELNPAKEQQKDMSAGTSSNKEAPIAKPVDPSKVPSTGGSPGIINAPVKNTAETKFKMAMVGHRMDALKNKLKSPATMKNIKK